jgi:D-beta-D-heptose 7-phosphate kinase/D-beta-D-heptose 1-phosphate adenosyltransferase
MTKKILVIGDLFLDIYSKYQSIRNSPEINAPVLINKKKEFFLGGCGNVAANLRSFNEAVTLISFFSNDKHSYNLKKILKKKKIKTYFLHNPNYKNISKERVLKNDIQIARIDNEKKINHNNKSLKKFEAYLKANIKNFKSIIISDYAKGFINKKIIKIVTSLSNKYNIPTFADPKSSNPKLYENVNFISPNYKEFKNFYPNLKNRKKISKIFNQTKINYLIVTHGSNGSFYINKNFKKVNFKAYKILKKDVSGAGDTFIASLCYAYTFTRNIDLSMNFANKMSSEVVKIKNISVPNNQVIKAQKKKILQSSKSKIIQIWKRKKFKIGLTNGCFDLYHKGHQYLLSECKKYCDKLIVLLNSDASIRLNKGKTRPIEKISIRLKNIRNNINVDDCKIFSEKHLIIK